MKNRAVFTVFAALFMLPASFLSGQAEDTAEACRPKYLEVIPLDGRLMVKWDMPGSCQVQEYLVYRSGADEPGWRVVATVENKFFVDSGLQNGIKYSYLVKPVDMEDNYMEISETVSGIPMDLASMTNTVYIHNARISSQDPEGLTLSILLGKTEEAKKAQITICDSRMKPLKLSSISVKKSGNPLFYKWNLKNGSRGKAPAGDYYVRIKAGAWEHVGRFSITD